MADIEIKNALAAWKKAKPLTLTKTGVSEAIRPISAFDPKKISDVAKTVKELKTCKKVLEVSVANKHIMAHKTAHQCVKDILKTVTAQLGALEVWEEKMNMQLKNSIKFSVEFLKTPNPALAENIKKCNAEINKLFGQFTPTNVNIVQVPTRLELLAKNVLVHLNKPSKANAIGEMTKYVSDHKNISV